MMLLEDHFYLFLCFCSTFFHVAVLLHTASFESASYCIWLTNNSQQIAMHEIQCIAMQFYFILFNVM